MSKILAALEPLVCEVPGRLSLGRVSWWIVLFGMTRSWQQGDPPSPEVLGLATVLLGYCQLSKRVPSAPA